MVDKATELKRRKLEGAGKKAAVAAVPVHAPRDAQGRPSGTLPTELVELAKDATKPMEIDDAVDLAAACGVDDKLLLQAEGLVAEPEA